MSVIEIKDLVKRYGRFTALNGLNLQVGQGEVYGFIGPNGAGKTTAIRVLLGILKATSGRAALFGEDAWENSVELHRRIAYVPGDVSLWPNLTGGEVIDLLTSLRGGGGAEKRRELLERFELDPTKKCRAYSKGNRQKIALVAALSSEAELYIFDEPTSGLDPLMEQVFKSYVRELKSEGRTVFLSSHILTEVEQLCDRVGIIRHGEIVETGTMDELRHLTHTKMTVETLRDIPNPESLSGVSGVERRGNALTFRLDNGAVGPLIETLAVYGVKRLENVPPTLEELFMDRYEGREAAGK